MLIGAKEPLAAAGFGFWGETVRDIYRGEGALAGVTFLEERGPWLEAYRREVSFGAEGGEFLESLERDSHSKTIFLLESQVFATGGIFRGWS